MTRSSAFLVLILLATPAQAADWVSPAGEPPGPVRVQAVPGDGGSWRVVVEVPGFRTAENVVAGRRLAGVTVPGTWPTLVAGEPELPRLALNLRLPETGTPEVRVVAETWSEVPTLPVLPSRGNVLRDRPPTDVPRVFGPAYTEGGVHPPAAFSVGRPYLLREHRGLGLTVHPLRWDADRDVLLVLTRLELEVVTAGSGGVNVRETAPPPPSVGFSDLADRRFLNAAPEKYQEVAAGGRLLVVAPAEFVAALEPFAQWKRERGLPVEIATVADLGGTAQSIADAVAARYAAPEGLTYLILAGDVAQVPTHAGPYEGADDDTRYALVDGDDLYPDLFVSRISARDDDELRTQLAKFIRYERDPDAAAPWYARAVGVASGLGDPTDAERAEWLREDLLGYTFTEVDRLYEPGATGPQITAAVNAGRSLLNYLGHGSGSSWSNPAFTVTDVHALANGWRQPWIVDVSCANGRFSDPECFAEAWLRAGDPAQPRGAVAMYSASTTTPWVPPTVMQAEVVDLLTTGQADEIGALYQHGIMKVLDTYPGEIGQQLVEQYNIFGDCTLQVRTAPPRPLLVEHAGSLAVGVPVFPLAVDAPGATVALTAPGALLGSAIVDADGRATVVLASPPTEPGTLTLTVSGRNLMPHRETLAVTAPLAVQVDRDQVPVGTTTAVRVDTANPVGVAGDLAVSVTGWGVDLPAVAVAPGQTAVLDVTPLYGETLALWVREAATGRDLHHAILAVTGSLPLIAPQLTAGAPVIAMDGTMAPGVEGVVRGRAGEAGLSLQVRGCGVDTVVTSPWDSVVVQVVPVREGVMTAALLKPGRDVVELSVPVIPARGTLAGVVVPAGGGPGLHLARVRVFALNDDTPLLDATSDPVGAWSLTRDLPVGEYRVRVERYGYTTNEVTRALLHGENNWEIPLALAPRGTARGGVAVAGTGQPLAAVLEIHRPDNGQHVATATAAADGRYQSPLLPVGDYEGVLRYRGHAPLTLTVEVAEGGAEHTHVMEPLRGRIIVVGDNLPYGTNHSFPPRLDKPGGTLSAGYVTLASTSAQSLWGTLLTLGYPVVDIVPAALADPATWPDYELVVVACGDNPAPLGGGLRDALADHVARGGRLLLEGGEVAAVHGRDAAFARDVLHITRWVGDRWRDETLAPVDHPITLAPIKLFAPLALVTPGYASSDEVVADLDARAAVAWAAGADAVVCYDPDPDPANGQIVFLPWDLQRMAPQDHERLLQNAVEWLLATPAATAGIVGRVETADGNPATGARVRMTPGGREAVVGPGGIYVAGELVPGPYTLTVLDPDVGAVVRPVELVAAGVCQPPTVILPFRATTAAAAAVGATVPDAEPTGTSSTVVLEASGPVTGVRLNLELEHPWSDDLAVDLTCPSGRTVRLRHAGHAGRPDPAGWYRSDEDAAFGALLGEEAGGAWLLRISDVVPEDTGTFVTWSLEVDFAGEPDSETEPDVPEVPAVLALLGNHPNPFNPATTIRFSVPAPGPVEVDVFDLRGRRVRTLPHQAVAAGVQEVRWWGRDDAGRELASGVYLVRVTAPAGRVTGKMMLLR